MVEPWAEFRWELMPGGIGAEHPEDASQHDAGGTADAADGCSGSKQRLHADPVRLPQVRPVRARSLSPRQYDGRSGSARHRTCPSPRQDMAAAGDRLGDTPPPGPAQMELAVLDGLG